LLTFENGDQYQNVCSNALRTASVMLMCGTKQVRRKRERMRERVHWPWDERKKRKVKCSMFTVNL